MLTKNTTNIEAEKWRDFDYKVFAIVEAKRIEKFKTLNKKLVWLRTKNQSVRKPVQTVSMNVPEFVKNLSSVEFTQAEEDLLNKGLNFCVQPKFAPMEDIVANLEVAVERVSREEKCVARSVSKEIIKHSNITRATSQNRVYHSIVKSLREKDVYYMKADKGNAVVILNKAEYDDRVQLMIDEGPYEMVNSNPIKELVKKAREARSRIGKKFGAGLQWRLLVSNPSIPKLYALPKIHKPGNQMRPIVSNNNAPWEKISKWLVEQFSKLGPLPGRNIKNVYELTDKLQRERIQQQEIMVSFDVTALYPSIPIDETLLILSEWLENQHIDQESIDLYCMLTRTCMKESYFQFRGKTYKQTFGTSMGNSLSPFMANLFMGNLEEKMQIHRIFPRIWYRYVDDVFAVIGKNQTRRLLKFLNDQSPSIKFTMENEENNQLPFLDIMVKKEENRFRFSIYRKPTATDRYITNESYHPVQHKRAAFNSMIHRLVHIPQNLEDYEAELQKIKQIAIVNGYTTEIVDQITQSCLRKKVLTDATTLSHMSEPIVRSKVNYCKGLSSKLKKEWKNFNVDLVESSESKLGQLLGSTKDTTEDVNKSGIYNIQCNDCDKIYIGQSRRAISERYKEHLACIRANNPEKSSVAKHILESGHNIDVSSLSLMKQVRDNRLLDPLECWYIRKNKTRILNSDLGPKTSCLFEL